MADQLYFSRDTRFFVQFRATADNTEDAANLGKGAFWEIPILDGYSFSQTTNTSEITLAEMESTAGISRRGRRMFTDSLAPAEWSFSSYIRPFESTAPSLSSGVGVKRADSASEGHGVEEVLWAHMFGADAYTLTGGFTRAASAVSGPVLTPKAGSSSDATMEIVTTESNRSALNSLVFWFLIDTDATNPLVYRLPEAVVNEVSIDFDVDGIATLNWSGFAKEINDVSDNVCIADGNTSSPSALAGATDRVDSGGDPVIGDLWINTLNSRSVHWLTAINTSGTHTATQAIDEGISSTKNFIRNRLTSVSIETADAADKVSGTFPGAIATISAIDVTNEVITTSTPHNFKTGDQVHITGCTGNVDLNGSHKFVRVGDETSTYAGTTNTTTEFALFDSKVEAEALGNAGGLVAIAAGTYNANTGTVANGKYSLTLTGGSFTISNNVTYLVPEELGAINKPLEHVTGTRTATAAATCYLTLDDAAGEVGLNGTSRQFFTDMVGTNALAKVVNKFKVTMDVGGSAACVSTGTDAGFQLILPAAHIEVPTHSIEDIISLETNMQALPTSLGDADEIETITYFPPSSY